MCRKRAARAPHNKDSQRDYCYYRRALGRNWEFRLFISVESLMDGSARQKRDDPSRSAVRSDL